MGLLACGPGVPGPSTAHRVDLAIANQVMRRGIRDLDGHHVARADRTVLVEPAEVPVSWRCEMHQAVISGPTGKSPRRAILAAFAVSDQQLQYPADLFLVFLPRDVVLQRDQPFVAL